MRINEVSSMKFNGLVISPEAKKALAEKGDLYLLDRLNHAGEVLKDTKYYDLILKNKYLRPIIQATKLDKSLFIKKNDIAKKILVDNGKYIAHKVQHPFLPLPVVYIQDFSGKGINSLSNLEYLTNILLDLEAKARLECAHKLSTTTYGRSEFYNKLENLYKKFGERK